MTDLRYSLFAREADGWSATYAALSRTVAADHELLALIDTLPERSRQPNLLFGAVRLLGGPVSPWPAFREFVTARWDAVAHEMRTRITQTNEIGRCALLLPLLASLPQPLALLEVGASAGLGLYPDRYAYAYSGRTVGSGVPLLDCEFAGSGSFLPDRVPEVVWRAGLDLNPLDVRSASDLDWLEALIWPEQTHRRARLREAAALAAADPPLLVRGDLVADLPALAASAPPDATLVVFHTSVLYLVPPEPRQAFVELVRSLPGHWISVEAPGVLPFPGLPAPPDDEPWNVVALDGTPMAWGRGHGQAMTLI
ncbi:DUF2332 domain-containing protein [Catenuloplanes japonicus]|uniref:DUF2332 domain-containing protein n=1 Tax=Catenuloplanes japonicus TaxID=33876 RepID=UPI0005240947|nr:DUF2332 domain-containing protein [Catenuloplanes japonicus]